VLLDGLRVALWDCLHGGEVAFDALLLEGGFVEIGVGANEEAGLAFDGGAEGFEVATGFRRDEDEGLLGFVGNDDGGSFGRLLVPGVDFGEPVVGRLVGCAAEKGDDEQQVIGLGGRKIGFDPDLVAGLEIWDFGDGKRAISAGDADIDLRASEVETCCVSGIERCGKGNGE